MSDPAKGPLRLVLRNSSCSCSLHEARRRLSVAAAEQRVVLGLLLATHTHLAWLQLLQGLKGDTQTLGPHGGGARLQVLVPVGWGGKEGLERFGTNPCMVSLSEMLLCLYTSSYSALGNGSVSLSGFLSDCQVIISSLAHQKMPP